MSETQNRRGDSRNSGNGNQNGDKYAQVKKVLLTILYVALALAAILAIAFVVVFIFVDLPEPTVPEATRLYDINGKTISSLFVENRVVVPLEEIPDTLKQAVIAVEDKRFYTHHGVDPRAIGRALIRNITAGKIVEGGSTITQQLSWNLFLTHEQTLRRKFMEAVYALKLEQQYTKDEILEMYLNIIYLGHGTYGCETAARLYFGKSVKDLTLGEAATIAGIIKGPEYYSPYNNMELAISRRNLVLDLMVEQGVIDEETAEQAKTEPIELAEMPTNTAAYFTDFVIAEIREVRPEIASGIYKGGYEIYTTLDLDMQLAAEKAFSSYIPEGQKDADGITQPQGALVAVEPGTGYIKALIGGRDWAETQFNRAYQSRRQPGSAFKIFLYTAVLDLGHPIVETKMCEPVEFPGASPGEVYIPKDFGWPPYHNAPLDIRTAVAISDNVVATRWIDEIGPRTVIQYAKRLGVKSPLQPNIPLALGASEVTPLEMAAAAAALSAQGVYAEPMAVLRVLDSTGRVLMENKPNPKQALDPVTAYMVTDVLTSVLGPGGTGAGVRNFIGGRPAAGKTGTSDGQLEAWFVGYTRELSCAVYVGWDNREQSLPGTGGRVAGPIWGSFVSMALAGRPYKGWPMPDGLYKETICNETGLIAGEECTDVREELFRVGTEWPVCSGEHEETEPTEEDGDLPEGDIDDTDGELEEGDLPEEVTDGQEQPEPGKPDEEGDEEEPQEGETDETEAPTEGDGNSKKPEKEPETPSEGDR